LTASPVKALALEQGVPILQPATLADVATVDALGALHADLFVVVAYGLLLPQHLLDMPRAGCVNVHASLLPRWRGAAPIQASILAGDRRTGVSLMRMEAGLDSGPVYATAELPIGASETAGELHDRLAALGAALLADKLPQIASGALQCAPQDNSGVTIAGKIRTADARLDWQQDAGVLERRVRAYNPVPGAWFMHAGERLKCWRAEAVPAASRQPPGQVLAAGEQGIDVACAAGVLRLMELQRPGRNRQTAGEFSRPSSLAGERLA
jgi:methionyl-tRNA formyltransferase